MPADSATAMNQEEEAALREWLVSDADSRNTPLSAGYQGSVYLFEGPAGPRIIKEAIDTWPQRLLARRMLRREARAYDRVSGIPGIPESFGMLDDRYLVLEFVPGKNLRDPDNGITDREAFFAGLLNIIKEVHARDVTHNDLKRKDNVLVTASGEPVLLDFGMAVCHRRQGFFYRLLKRMDYNAWIKIKYHYATDQITEADQPYYRPTLLERGFRQLRRFWRIITFRQWRKARQRAKSSR